MAFGYQNYASLGVNLNRQKYGPLDISTVFTSQADLNYYISKGSITENVSQYWLDVVPYPYAGQIVALVSDNNVAVFVLNETADGNFETKTIADSNVNAEANVVEIIKANGTALSVVDKAVNIPLASDDIVGLVRSSAETDKVAVTPDGTMEVNSLSISKLVQAVGDELILDGGSSNV